MLQCAKCRTIESAADAPHIRGDYRGRGHLLQACNDLIIIKCLAGAGDHQHNDLWACCVITQKRPAG